jgi:hypothetical protein
MSLPALLWSCPYLLSTTNTPLPTPQSADCEAIQKSNAYLLSKQRADGGWGESYLSCVTHECVPSLCPPRP